MSIVSAGCATMNENTVSMRIVGWFRGLRGGGRWGDLGASRRARFSLMRVDVTNNQVFLRAAFVEAGGAIAMDFVL